MDLAQRKFSPTTACICIHSQKDKVKEGETEEEKTERERREKRGNCSSLKASIDIKARSNLSAETISMRNYCTRQPRSLRKCKVV